MAKNEGARKEGQFIIVSMTPDVCKLPNGTPVPYNITACLEDSVRFSSNVNFAGYPAMTMNGRVSKVKGDEPGSGGGVKSGVNIGYCRPIKHSTSVQVNKYKVLYRDDTTFWMNCNGPEGPGNTIGKLKFLGASGGVSITADGKVEQPPPPQAETPKELPWFKKIINKLGGLGNLKKIGKTLWKLKDMDWSNPWSVIGLVGDMAGIGQGMGIAGLANVARAAEMAAKIKKLKDTDWKNPGEVLAAAQTIASMKL